MAQHDYDIANQGFPAFRTDLNNVLEAVNTSNSGTSRPSSAVAGTVWLDTTNATNPTLKFFDGTDDISLAQLDYTANTVNWLDSTVTISPLTTDLDVGGNAIVSSSNGNITFTPDGTGKVIIDGLSHPTADGTAGQFMKTDGSGNLSFDTVDLTNLSATNLTSGTVPIARLGTSGTKDATTFLRGDNTFAEPSGGGITEADMFRLTADFLSNSDPISSNLERVDDASFSKIGTGMSVSSGIFTFPTTGLYEVTFNLDGRANATTWQIRISATTNNSTYDLIAQADSGSSDNRGINTITSSFVNVTNTSNVKVKFHTNFMNGADTTAYGDTSVNRTFFKFIRLGDSQ